MTPNEYQELALRTAPDSDAKRRMGKAVDSERAISLLHAQIGITTELGEFADVIKKTFAYRVNLDFENAKEELGDILWYIALAAQALDTNIETLMLNNTQKLSLRYPEKFTEKDALERKDKALVYPQCGCTATNLCDIHMKDLVE